jgi:hypothetical protein
MSEINWNAAADDEFARAFERQRGIINRRDFKNMMDNLDDPEVAERNRQIVQKLMSKKSSASTVSIGEFEPKEDNFERTLELYNSKNS